MKKVLAAVLVVSVMLAAGSAFAQPSIKRQPQPQRHQLQRRVFAQGDYGRCPCYPESKARDFRGPRRDFDGGRGNPDQRPNFAGPEKNRIPFAPDMPKEIREKVVELAKLRIDLEEALTSKPINKAKAIEIHAKMQNLEKEIEAWRFAKKLDRIEEMKTQRELNRKVKPVPPAPKPENKPDEAPEVTEE